jgi:hypothetical protein
MKCSPILIPLLSLFHEPKFARGHFAVGEKDLACEQLAIAIRPPSTVSYGQLKLLPFWDPLRKDLCFEKHEVFA